MNKTNKRSKQSKQGKNADASIFKRASDQFIAAGKARYFGRSRMANLANVANDVRLLKSMVNTENKRVDSLFTVQTCTAAAPLVLAIAPPAQGADSNQRNGRSVKLDRLDVICQFTWNGGTGASVTVYTQNFRWFVVKYLPTTSATPFAINDFLNTDANTQTSYMSLRNNDLDSDFRILDQGTVAVQQYATNSQSTEYRDVSLPLSFHQTFNSTTSASIQDGMIFFVCVAAVTSGVGGASAIIPQFRLWYIDN